jgi:hypothetical protein
MFIQKYKIEDHIVHKHELLDLIELLKLENNLKPATSGYKHDFHHKGDKLYLEKFYSIVKPCIDQYAHNFGCKYELTYTAWFHQYTQGQEFGWHTHDRSIAVIYFLELPDPIDATEFFKLTDLNIVEGDVIIFPSYLPHRCPKIQTKRRKTIIADNIYLHDDRDLIQQYTAGN